MLHGHSYLNVIAKWTQDYIVICEWVLADISYRNISSKERKM